VAVDRGGHRRPARRTRATLASDPYRCATPSGSWGEGIGAPREGTKPRIEIDCHRCSPPTGPSRGGSDAPAAGTRLHPRAIASGVKPHLDPRRRASMPLAKERGDARHPCAQHLPPEQFLHGGHRCPSSTISFALEIHAVRTRIPLAGSPMPSTPFLRGIDALRYALTSVFSTAATAT
jgi:hypothetical protein